MRTLQFIERGLWHSRDREADGALTVDHLEGTPPKRRNAPGRLAYRASTAQWHADCRARRPKVAKLVANDALRDYVQSRLRARCVGPTGHPVAGPAVNWRKKKVRRYQDRRWAQAWSPEQIARRLAVDFPNDVSMRISHEAIYQSLYVQGRGALKRDSRLVCAPDGRFASRASGADERPRPTCPRRS